MYPVDYNGVRVLTTEQLAQAYGCEPNNIKSNFNANKSHFEEGKHFFKLEGEDLKGFKDEVRNSNLVGKNASCLYLWTRRGASRHANNVSGSKQPAYKGVAESRDFFIA